MYPHEPLHRGTEANPKVVMINDISNFYVSLLMIPMLEGMLVYIQTQYVKSVQ